MKPILSAHDKRCINKLIESKLFQRIMTEKLDISNGIIIAPCSDGDQFDDTYKHIASICNMPTNRIHPVALNGGAILMGNRLPEEQSGHGDCMFENILKASEIKSIKDVFLYGHFPCAIARANSLGVVDQGLSLMEAKKRLKEAATDLRIRCFFHIDMYDEVEGNSHKKRTYFMPKEMWNNEELTLPVLHDYRSGL